MKIYNSQVKIDTNIEHAGIVDNSKRITNAQQNNIQEKETCPNVGDIVPAESALSGPSPIYFKGKRGQKIDLFRVIQSLLDSGFFTDENGDKPTQDSVYNAFGKLLHTDFSKYYKNLSEGKKTNSSYDEDNNDTIFEKLRGKWTEYITREPGVK